MYLSMHKKHVRFKFKYEFHVYKREANRADYNNPNKWLTITEIKP